MTLLELIKEISAGNIVAILVIILSGIEFAPKTIIKFSPLEWIGKRVNASTIKRLDELDKRLDKVEGKIDEHVAQSYRNKILEAQNKLLSGHIFTMEEFDEIIDAATNYERYCADNNVANEKCKLAISYLHHCYRVCQDNRSFANLPNIGGDCD